MTGLLVVLMVVLLLVMGVPLFAVLGITVLVCLSVIGAHDPVVMAQQMNTTLEQPVIFAIPFFILAGSIMTNGGIARRLVDIARAAVGGVPGGLGVATVLGCMFFAAISGSSPVTVVAVGSMMLPALLKESYGERFSVGLVTSAGSLGILIPPSIPMIIYAVVATVSVEQLFIAGVVPGFVIGILLMAYCVVNGWKARQNVQRTEPRMFSAEWARRLWTALRRGVWALFLPIIILGGIYGGLYIATEASAIAVVYAFIVERFIHKELKMRDVPRIFVEATVVMGALLVILTIAKAFNWYLSAEKIPEQLADAMLTVVDNPFMFLLLVNVLLLITGCFMDIISAILIITPLVAPIALKMGIDPIHLGVIFIVNLEIGYLTPPIGINLFVSSTVFSKSLPLVMRSVLPFLALLLVSLLGITYVPKLALAPLDSTRENVEYDPVILPPFLGGKRIETETVEPAGSATPTPSGVNDWFNSTPAPEGSPSPTGTSSANDWFGTTPTQSATPEATDEPTPEKTSSADDWFGGGN